ncbi:MAG: protein kinase [Nostoc sp. S4]|nr:protein kinase [Nostoc sp. S4]
MNIAVEQNAKLLNYQITEQLYISFRTLVYRAIREDDRLPVIIKLLHQEYPSFSELVHLSNHYTIAKNLNLPNIVRSYSLEPYGNSYALVMEDFGGISLREWMKAAIESNRNFLEEFLDIAIALSEILDGLYRHRIIHKDIKPANILINPQTKQVKLTDFSIASLLPRETQEIQHPDVLEDTLIYLSPEQTGRMNRQIDYRSDYYSLGITFYELLTGQLPFQSHDSMELVYSHIAKQPPFLRGVKSQNSKAASALGSFGDLKQLAIKSEEIPEILCDITIKLMAKNAEERYQSALGLKHDLEICRRQLQETGRIETFELGKQDICDRFIIPEKQALSISKSATSSSNTSFMLDMTTVLKASQSLSSEIELEKLLNTLLSIVIENAGADKCVLLLLKENRLVVEAIAQIGQQSTILQSIPVEDSKDVPRSLIYAVKRNLQPSVIIDTAMYSTPIADPYIMRQQPKSLLCLPILHQEKLLGILYLENNLNTGAFTSDGVEILNLLCTQVAISLENARMYQQAQDTLKNLGQTEQFLQLIIDNIPQSVFWKDRNSLYLWCNRNFAKAAGLKLPENIVGKNDYELPWTKEESDWYVECDRRIMESGQAELNIIETWQQADGKQIWANTNKIPLRDREGNVFGILGTIEDITERQEAEQLLQQQKQQLEQALQELQIMQLQLVQSEKMSALGNLVAGVAHEINNPIGFIAGNIEPAKDYVKELFGLINLYQQKFPHPGSEIEDEINAMDLNYLREDLPKLLESMKLGVSRIRSISNSLRNFSRADQDYKVPFDIHEGIDSTILILRHRLKANENRPGIEIVKDYGELPLVECFPGQLNQVFMNLLANAIDALEEYNIGRSLEEILANPNCITIKTCIAADGNHVLIKIADNGVGMSPEVKQKVFDHLFTTKPVGKGTGFGLAIARQIIVEVHGGSLSCTSELGQGTEFMIQISGQPT